jgi:outer membrane biosynthesis protein TonB
VRGNVSSNLDWFFTTLTVGSFIVHLCMVIYLRSVDWPKKPDIEEIPDRFVQMVVKKKPEPPPEPAKVDETKPAEEKKEVAKKPAPKEPAAGAPKKELSEADKKRLAEERAQAEADRRAKIAEQVQNTGILKLLGARADGEGAIADVLGKGDVDRDQEKAFEGVGGLSVATGEDSLRGVKSGTGGSGKVASISGLRGGGGGIGEASTGSVGGEKSVKAVVTGSPPSVDGELDPGVVAKEVKRRIGAVKACYERALKRNPALSGKIVVFWTITPEGTVSGVNVEQDSMGDSEVTQCIKQNISGWRFPRPAGGSVEVSFPFVFQASS